GHRAGGGRRFGQIRKNPFEMDASAINAKRMGYAVSALRPDNADHVRAFEVTRLLADVDAEGNTRPSTVVVGTLRVINDAVMGPRLDVHEANTPIAAQLLK